MSTLTPPAPDVVATEEPARHRTSQALGRSSDEPAVAPGARTADGATLLLCGLLVSGAAVHFAVAPQHVVAWRAQGIAFAAVAAVQGILAVGLAVRRSRSRLVAVAVVQAAVAGVWALSRATALPFGPRPRLRLPATTVDVLATATEVLSVLVVVALLLRREPRPGRGPARGLLRSTAAALPGVAVVALTAAVLVTPAGRHGAAGSTGGAAAVHGTAALRAPLALGTQRQLGQQLTAARRVALRYPTLADARRAGLLQAGPFNPGSALHMVDIAQGGRTSFDIERPLSWLYSGTSPTSPVVGVMYYLAQKRAPSGGFAGPLDEWHVHQGACYRPEPGGKLFVPFSPDADGTKADCDRARGTYLDRTGWMVHAWVVPGWDSPAGVFSHANPNIVCADGSTTVTDQSKGCRGT
ncbi:MAG: hypothetical protein HYX34_02250 [Actinobacteria bacterium]|nr:hypothetical protein [Actinomycetota bacterium]